MTQEQYIQYLRIIVTTAKLDTLATATLKEMNSTLQVAIRALLSNTYQGADLVANQRRADALYREFMAGLDAVTLATTGEVADVTANAWFIAEADHNNMLSWDRRVDDFNYVSHSLEDLRAGVLTAQVAGNSLGDMIEGVFLGAVDGIRQEMNAGRMAGETYEEIAARISGQLLANDARAQQDLTTIVRSYVQQANVTAQSEVYAANTDIIAGATWVASLENGNFSEGTGTCPRCAALDGQDFELDESGQPKNGPPCPLHPRCRCILAPKSKTWRDLGFDVDEMEDVYRPWVERTEEAIDLGGQRQLLDVGLDGTTYKELWLGNTPAFQNNSIGPWRAEMVRQNYIQFEDIIDKRGELIPIVDLRASYKIPGKGQGPVNLAYEDETEEGEG